MALFSEVSCCAHLLACVYLSCSFVVWETSRSWLTWSIWPKTRLMWRERGGGEVRFQPILSQFFPSTHLSRMRETSRCSTSFTGMLSSCEMKGILILVYGLMSLSRTWVLMFFSRSSM